MVHSSQHLGVYIVQKLDSSSYCLIQLNINFESFTHSSTFLPNGHLIFGCNVFYCAGLNSGRSRGAAGHSWCVAGRGQGAAGRCQGAAMVRPVAARVQPALTVAM
jgi:hypothetical protein